MNTGANATYVLWVILCGMGMGATFDFYNTVTGATRFLRPLRPVLDLAFWLISGVMVYYVTYITISGDFRLWVFLLVGVGYLSYRALFRTIVIGSAFVIVRIVKAIVLFFGRLLYRLIGIPLLVCGRGLWALLRILYIVLCRFEDVGAAIVRTTLRIVLFPARRVVHADRPWRKKLVLWEQGFWEWLSNLLKKKPNSVS